MRIGEEGAADSETPATGILKQRQIVAAKARHRVGIGESYRFSIESGAPTAPDQSILIGH